MKPEDIDKLFKERLGPSSPTPPADLWNRLQDRIETEMPATPKEEQKPRGFMYLSYSIAAAIALILSVGIVFYNVQQGTVPVDRDGLADRNGLKAEQPLIKVEPAAPEQQIAQVTAPAEAEAPVESSPVPAVTESAPATPTKSVGARQNTLAKAEPKSPDKVMRSNSGAKSPATATQLVAKVEQPAIPAVSQKSDLDNTRETVPATFAANTVDLNAQPVEIIIKRAVAVQQVEEDEELNGFEKKQKLAKNIFKQVRNLSNGERVELSELGINADKIALETQIGKQKISKVINL